MKKNYFLVLCLFLSAWAIDASAQNALHVLIRGERGRTTPFTRLAPDKQVMFTPSKAKTILGLDAEADLALVRTETDQLGEVHHRFNQVYKGIPVENSMYVMHTKKGKLTGMNGTIILEFDKQMAQRPSAPAITADNAVQSALKYVNAQSYAWQAPEMENHIRERTGNITASYFPATSLVWYSPGDQIDPADLHLAYKVDVYAMEPLSRAFYYIDAQTAQVLGKKDELFYTDATGTANTAYSGTQTIHSNLTGGSYQLRDLTKGNGIITLHGNSPYADYTSASANWNLSGADQYALDAHYGVSQTYSFYKTVFGRNSVDNNGYALYSYVNNSATIDNAYWDNAEMVFGIRSTNNAGLTGIDVTAHELTHGVTQYTSALNYSNESGAMNESMSDIMGKSVQFWSKPADVSWLLSNDMNWLIRNFANPKQFNQPNTYHGVNWYSGSSDNGGVHTNSGIGNYMFYLLVTGGSGTNDVPNAYAVAGIGLTEADAIIYRTETVYLVPTSQYADWRTACINAATDLFGANSNEVVQVENAWYAVGVGAAGSTPCGGNIIANFSADVTTVCVNSNVTFTNTTTGTVSSYAWNFGAGANPATSTSAGPVIIQYTTTGLKTVTLAATGSVTCSNTKTNYINVVNAASVASLGISSSPQGAACPGTTVNFLASPTNGGTSPSYQWKKNGVNVGTNTAVYADNALVNNDKVSCVMTSNSACIGGSPATSNTITMTMSQNTTFFTEDFESATLGSTGAWTEAHFGTYHNPPYNWFTAQTAGYPITNKTMEITNITSSGSSFGYGIQNSADTNFIPLVYKQINATGYSNLLLNFDWICNGEARADYGMFFYSLDGSSFTALGSQLQGQTAVQHITNLSLPSTLSNTSFYIGWAFYSNQTVVNQPGLSIDNIVVAGQPTVLGTGVLPALLCAGASLNVPYSFCGVVNAGNSFKAQLSDASGNFTSPFNTIGSLASTSNGTISCVIPAGTAFGAGYKIRVVSNNPALTGSDNGNSITINPLLTYYADVDGDGYGNPSVSQLACPQPPGYVSNNTDCNDNNGAIHPGVAEVCNGIDDNCNGQTDEGLSFTRYYVDADGDGYGAASDGGTLFCANPGAGYSLNNTDCNDGNGNVHPGVTEMCNGIDDNCNGQVDEGLTFTTYYIDADKDGFGSSSDAGTSLCSNPGTGYSINNTDCNDENAGIHPGVTETCNGIDDNCNGQVDEGLTFTRYYIDADKDSYGTVSDTGALFCVNPGSGYALNNTDCNDGNATIHPGATEVCNGIDDNCNGQVDEGVKTTFYRDADTDGFGNLNVTTQACTLPSGYVANSTDCNDTNASIHPGATEVCNGIDDNCNGQVDEGVKNTFYRDADGDGFGNVSVTMQACTVPSGYAANSTDCNDGNETIHPGAAETCNGIDDNCNGQIDEGLTFVTYYIDADGDGYGTSSDVGKSLCSNPGAGYATNNTDCKDGNANIHPGAAEVCNGFDDNCNGQVDEGLTFTRYYIDADGDNYGALSDTGVLFCTNPGIGYAINNTDCNDGNSNVHPGVTEACNGIDDNCNGQVDEGCSTFTYFADIDHDGYGDPGNSISSTSPTPPSGYLADNADCNDHDPAIHPGAIEICNGIDDNCNGQADEGLTFTTYYIDGDGDGYGALSDIGKSLCSDPGTGYSTNNTDCNDGNANVHPGAAETCNSIDDNCNGQVDEGVLLTFYRDADTDGFGDAGSTTHACSAPSGYVTNNADCNDSNASIHPGATELCNSIDDNCNGQIDEGVLLTFYQDEDNDGYGNVSVTKQACSVPAGYVADSTDCNDNNSAINPGVAEILCNSIDDNCDGQVDEGSSIPGTPSAIVAPSGTKACPGDIVTYNIAAMAKATGYVWKAPTGGTVTNGQGTTTVTITYGAGFTAMGTLSVKATNGCGNSAVRNLSITRNTVTTPGAITVSGGSATVCPGDARIYRIAAVAGATSYNWTAPTGATITSGQGTTTINITFNNAFTANGSLKVTASNGCGTSTARSLIISRNSPAEPGTITVTGGASAVCPGDARTYSVTAVTGITYTWTVPTGATITGGQGTHTINVSFNNGFTANGALKASATNGCGTNTARSLTITRNVPQTPGTISGSATACKNVVKAYSIAAVTAATSYIWAVPSGATIQSGQGTKGISVLWGTTGGNVTVRSSNACANSAAKSLAVKINCREDQPENMPDEYLTHVEIFPNPTPGNLTVKFSSHSSAKYFIRVMDITGRIMMNQEAEAKEGTNLHALDLSGFAKGMYIITLQSADYTQQMKVIVE